MLCRMLIIILSLFMLPSEGQVPTTTTQKEPARIIQLFKQKYCKIHKISSIRSIRNMLKQKSVGMSDALIQKVVSTLQCAESFNVRHKPILTVIDYSLPSNQKRLWIFDIRENRMLFHTYVSHGLRSGALFSEQFSNRHNSKASSLGVYRTDQSYYGRHGLSLRLTGLEPGFNSNASGRAIVMHSAWYVNEDFIKKYGRPGRSWGCPAIARTLKAPVINTIKDSALLIVYYPGEDWFLKSKYLNCKGISQIPHTSIVRADLKDEETRNNILFIERTKNNHKEESEPVAVVSADDYSKYFQHKVPLKRMLRQQIEHTEYVALSDDEFESIVSDEAKHPLLNEVVFVIPKVIMRGGRYVKTEMKVLPLGHITHVDADFKVKDGLHKDYVITFDKGNTRHLKTTNQFIRWLGL